MIMANRSETDGNRKRPPVSRRPTSPRRSDKSLLIVDDDRPFCERLARAMGSRGFTPRMAVSVAEGLAAIQAEAPAFAVIDLKLGDGSGLDVMRALEGQARRGAGDHPHRLWRDRHRRGRGQARRLRLSRQARQRRRDRRRADSRARRHVDGPEHPMSADRVRWEHIQRVYESCERNVSETARQLNMHRRTLQRILGKRAPR